MHVKSGLMIANFAGYDITDGIPHYLELYGQKEKVFTMLPSLLLIQTSLVL